MASQWRFIWTGLLLKIKVGKKLCAKHSNGVYYMRGVCIKNAKCHDIEVEDGVTSPVTPKVTKMDINLAHNVFGHIERTMLLVKTATAAGIELTGELLTCGACLILAKAKQKKFPKTPAQ
jgi:hypothetical protein